MTVGDRIKIARKTANITQAELAERLGVSFTLISQYERNLLNPKIDTLRRIADGLGVSVGVLVGEGILLQEIDNQVVKKLVANITDILSDISDLTVEQVTVIEDGNAENEFGHFVYLHIIPSYRSIVRDVEEHFSDIVDMVESHYNKVCTESNKALISQIADTARAKLSARGGT